MKNIKENKEIEELLDGAEGCIIATNKGSGIVGDAPSLLAMYIALTQNLAENIEKEQLERAFNFAFASKKELLEELKNKLDELLKKAGE